MYTIWLFLNNHICARHRFELVLVKLTFVSVLFII